MIAFLKGLSPECSALLSSLEKFFDIAQLIIACEESHPASRLAREDMATSNHKDTQIKLWCDSYAEIENVLIALMDFYGFRRDNPERKPPYRLQTLRILDNPVNPLLPFLEHEDRHDPYRNKPREMIESLRFFKRRYREDDRNSSRPERFGVETDPPKDYRQWYTTLGACFLEASFQRTWLRNCKNRQSKVDSEEFRKEARLQTELTKRLSDSGSDTSGIDLANLDSDSDAVFTTPQDSISSAFEERKTKAKIPPQPLHQVERQPALALRTPSSRQSAYASSITAQKHPSRKLYGDQISRKMRAQFHATPNDLDNAPNTLQYEQRFDNAGAQPEEIFEILHNTIEQLRFSKSQRSKLAERGHSCITELQDLFKSQECQIAELRVLVSISENEVEGAEQRDHQQTERIASLERRLKKKNIEVARLRDAIEKVDESRRAMEEALRREGNLREQFQREGCLDRLDQKEKIANAKVEVEGVFRRLIDDSASPRTDRSVDPMLAQGISTP